MSQAREIDYEALIDRSIKDFQPANRFWPITLRIALWILLEASILTLAAGFRGFDAFPGLVHNLGYLAGIGAPILTSIAAGYLALRSSIPGREVTPFELLLLTAALCAASAIGLEPLTRPTLSPESLHADLRSMVEMIGLAALPWIALFCAAQRGVPLQPVKTGGLVGIAAFCFALAGRNLISQPSALPGPIIWQVVFAVFFIAASALVGAFWLSPERRWQEERRPIAEKRKWISFGAATAFPLAIAASIVALILVLNTTGPNFAHIPDFDLAIENYEQSLTGFRPNVPSSSIATVLTAYVEHGMPSYMWDFDREGFKLVGGRWERLPNGTPVTYTWFHGSKGGVMCMFRQTDGFNPPSAPHEEHDHLLFYVYRGFSVCLINVGGYGNFISVIVAPIPMRQFVPLVLAAAV